MNDAYRTCPVKGINAPELESKVLDTCKKYFEEQSFHNRLNDTIFKDPKTATNEAQTITSNTSD